ncbi:hypothetical protein GCM10007036_21740 [Alsobacter metallidurans]|uniref:Uncharacterized protein n=1 Tax=Alsobacter metallidurans TaxID=340221 RepID=A0A917I8A4_9HYPH|nr:hypothetical protein [Alsobacter metallidurans]GGH19094.1 hypothetical protein GCM10007036_21740 [Alsobacter metallidurans]
MRNPTGAILAMLLASPAWAYDGWHLEKAIPVASGTAAFDYITFDAQGQRVFVGHRKDGLQVVDVKTGALLATVPGTPAASSNGAVLIPELDLGVSNNENGTLTPFKLSTLQVGEPVKLGEELDTSHYDPYTKRLFVNMSADASGSEIAVLETPSLRKIGSIKLASKKLEHAAFDEAGTMFLAARDLDLVYRIDTTAMTATAQWPTTNCGQANSTAYDVANKRLFVACRGNDKIKPSLIVIDAGTGAVGFKAEIGGGNDGLVFDPKTKRIFAANGLSANLNVFEQVSADDYRPVEALGTRAMVKVLAYDPEEQKLYSMTAEGAADFSKKINTAVSPFYPNTFRPNTFSVLIYSK